MKESSRFGITGIQSMFGDIFWLGRAAALASAIVMAVGIVRGR